MHQTPPTPSTIVDLVKVSKTYHPDTQALVDISLNVCQGEILFLTGVSGAGKTTLLRLISHIERPTKGMIEVAGIDLGKLPRNKIHLLRRKVGTAYQDFKLLSDRTVADNIAIAMEVIYRPSSHIEQRTRTLLDQLDLATKYNTRAGDLSRGEQQRVAIARAVANNPEIVLADEPTGNLDAETTARVMELFYQLNRQGTTLLIATHDRSLFADTGHRVIELRSGKIKSTVNRSLKNISEPTEEVHTVQESEQ
ncbi:cell division ATP-binding protein FtsE [Desulfobulbus oligotrophicus]|jgi:cell division transport system ATP-binding protein|uniref:Cell division ATP-binding protein FtsE n=1 Tax=Desulfobulbus oligotrophicus TaxID=1909699 RepID=A0A7T6ARM1_9BACT|nr:cell division ATP-binding protein FtsE [Desulfobulbus oligotrophicus]MDY0391403.1 cell division ATP-binding protein FtsE [Desulfobulbus oligotrophicus]QQG66680.1 cell division ATP-binding protein FtsE [Desulfobulbus oligotrophicus]